MVDVLCGGLGPPHVSSTHMRGVTRRLNPVNTENFGGSELLRAVEFSYGFCVASNAKSGRTRGGATSAFCLARTSFLLVHTLSLNMDKHQFQTLDLLDFLAQAPLSDFNVGLLH